MDQRSLMLLAKEYPTIKKAAAEIINLNAILMLPKGTEYFFSDLHGEHEAFLYLLKSVSGEIRNKIDIIFEHTLPDQERKSLADLIYYPEQQLYQLRLETGKYDESFFKITVFRLLEVVKKTSAKFTRSKVRKKAPKDFAYIIDELLHVEYDNRALYFSGIIQSILETGMAEQFIIGMCKMIRDLAIDMLHIIGDIYDRGPHPDLIMNELMAFHDVDIQWGNHDISWIGAACGNLTCIANVLRANIRYNSFDLLEDSYGINLRPLATFASNMYRDDPCELFYPRILDENKYDPVDPVLAAKMHKAITIMQFKLEGQLYEKHPEYGMEARNLLKMVNYETGTIQIGDKIYPLKDSKFPTVYPSDPLSLSKGEAEVLESIASSFRHSEKLQRHIRFLYANGGMFKCINQNLLFHGCIPMTKDGEFDSYTVDGIAYKGKAFLEYIDAVVKNSIFSSHRPDAENPDRDFLWYLWCGEKSPLFGKHRMTTFEQYFIEDKSTHKEIYNPYYDLMEDVSICEKILCEFGLDPKSAHIINGHVPVKMGEDPVKAGGKLFIIDGGISKAYHAKTGIGGYTLIYNSTHLALAEHKPFVNGKTDNAPLVRIVENMEKRILVGDTDKGKILRQEIKELKELIQAYRNGAIREQL